MLYLYVLCCIYTFYVARRPVVCGVTSLGIDHTNILGNTIESIAWNKAGIFKVNTLNLPFITGVTLDVCVTLILFRMYSVE